MSAPAQQPEERVPIGQVLFDDFFLLFLIGVALPFVLYTVWGLINIGSTPLAKPIAISAPAASPTGAADVTLNVTMSEFKFALDKTSVPAGKVVRFVLVNKGAIEHEFVIEQVGAVHQPLMVGGKEAEIVVKAGATGYLDWTFTDPGEYQIGCHIAGHYEAGMVTKITVTK